MHTEPSSIPVPRTRITLKNVPAERATRYSDEDALSTRLVQFIHQHMPVRVLEDGRPTQIQVNRDVVTLEPVQATESPERA